MLCRGQAGEDFRVDPKELPDPKLLPPHPATPTHPSPLDGLPDQGNHVFALHTTALEPLGPRDQETLEKDQGLNINSSSNSDHPRQTTVAEPSAVAPKYSHA